MSVYKLVLSSMNRVVCIPGDEEVGPNRPLDSMVVYDSECTMGCCTAFRRFILTDPEAQTAVLAIKSNMLKEWGADVVTSEVDAQGLDRMKRIRRASALRELTNLPVSDSVDQVELED